MELFPNQHWTTFGAVVLNFCRGYSHCDMGCAFGMNMGCAFGMALVGNRSETYPIRG